ncbi:uncharacterized protein ASCRUDRAFT_134347 [Ascoidea rubescens DSM 1968]|uniref:Uncharacterized protein n=1 Tax=Ascoidea rubescens DSM 1968 TaxID=1344418 RepID=A0A1D2VL62_9ASCO|nr:hypothetical protein ASCRUDRAFT_134347 [Ascoidea rubescens DSM 1968]ODV62348.1 hypothetical protein ASCRUDRAFT_134347 [Ascoidea rubescens DSM 1968]
MLLSYSLKNKANNYSYDTDCDQKVAFTNPSFFEPLFSDRNDKLRLETTNANAVEFNAQNQAPDHRPYSKIKIHDVADLIFDVRGSSASFYEKTDHLNSWKNLKCGTTNRSILKNRQNHNIQQEYLGLQESDTMLLEKWLNYYNNYENDRNENESLFSDYRKRQISNYYNSI